jgi:hypothetical protein
MGRMGKTARGGSQSAYQLSITDHVFLRNSGAVLGTIFKVKWFVVPNNFNVAISPFYPLGPSETSPPTQDAVLPNLITLSTRFLTTTNHYGTAQPLSG